MKKTTTKKTIKLYWQHAWRYPVLTLGTLTSIPIAVLVSSFLPPLVVANVLDRLASGDYQPDAVWASFGSSLVLYGVLLFSGTLLWRVIDAFDWRLEGKVERDLAQRIYAHLLSQSANFHANSFSGSLVSQSSKLLGAYIRISDTTVYNSLQLFWAIVFTALLLVGRAPLFVVAFLIFSIAYIATAIVVTRKVRRLSSKMAAAESAQTGYLADSVTNVLAVKSFAGDAYEKKQFAKITEKTRSLLLELMHAMQRQMMVFSSLNGAIQLLALVVAVITVVSFDSNIATVFLILNFTTNVANRLFEFSNGALRSYNRAFGDASDMTEILQLEPEVKDPVSPEQARMHNGAIAFNSVTFTHDGADGAIFHQFDLNIPEGQKVGLVGHSGSGKTTFTRLLLRFSDLDGGEITIDGQDIANVTQNDLHRAIAYVPQEPIMFHRSLEDNIRYGDFKASKDKVLLAAKAAHAHEFIKDLPEGYDTLVGERGVKLSGGQRQRVAIARAMLKDAPILVLDEATSALDSESEVLIQDALWKLMEGRTAIVIAHRLSTIQKMDRIIVLDNGKIIEEGSHKELIAKNGKYAELWNHQSGGFLED